MKRYGSGESEARLMQQIIIIIIIIITIFIESSLQKNGIRLFQLPVSFILSEPSPA
jgi:hypothetical protein